MNWLAEIDPAGHIYLILISLALGAFVGLRREIQMQQQGIPGFVGFRTMPLVVLLGTISTMFPLFPYMPIICLVSLIVFLAIAYYNGVFQLQFLGLTSELATLVMFFVGLMVGYGAIAQAIVVTICIATFSAFKDQMHRFAGTISPAEWAGALQLLIISAVVLPILPRTALDPWGALVPYDIWRVVIFIAGIGFVGYFLNKYFGQKKSILLTSLLGSFVSSTAVTTSIAIQARKDTKKTNHDMYVAGIVISIATMLARVALVVAVLAPTQHLLSIVFLPIGMLCAALVMGAFWYVRSQDERAELEKHTRKSIPEPEMTSPFDILPALQFAALFICVLLGVQIGQHYFGSYGVIITTFFSAFADVDAAIISVIETLKTHSISIDLVALVMTIALVVNTMVKALYVWLISRDRGLSLHVLVVTTFASLAGVVVYLFV